MIILQKLFQYTEYMYHDFGNNSQNHIVFSRLYCITLVIYIPTLKKGYAHSRNLARSILGPTTSGGISQYNTTLGRLTS